MVVGFTASCAVAVVAERGCRGAREVHCVVVAAVVRTKKMVMRRLLDGVVQIPTTRLRGGGALVLTGKLAVVAASDVVVRTWWCS